jgi:FtsZ-interacting cell division protein ZipA
MTQTAWMVVGVVLVVALIVGAVLWSRRARSEHLRDQFGPEYDRAVEARGDQAKAEADLAAREARVKKLDIRPLESAERREFTARWQQVQARFVDDPARAVSFADVLIGEVMNARGYPVTDFDQRAGDISVDHPVVVDHYHKAHSIAVRHSRGDASTEDLRQAMIHYRALFDNLAGASLRAVEDVGEPMAAAHH